MIWVQSSRRALDIGNDWRSPRFELLKLVRIIGNGLRDMRDSDGKLQPESRLAAVFIRDVVYWKNRRRGAIDGATVKAKGFSRRFFGSSCAVHTDLASGDTLLAVAEYVCLNLLSANSPSQELDYAYGDYIGHAHHRREDARSNDDAPQWQAQALFTCCALV